MPVTVIACELTSDMLKEWIEQDHPYVRELGGSATSRRSTCRLATGRQFTKPAELGRAIVAAVGPA